LRGVPSWHSSSAYSPFCHLERRERTRARVRSCSRKTPRSTVCALAAERYFHHAPRRPVRARIPCQFFPGCMQTRGPSTTRERPSDDHAPLGMTVGCWAADLRSAGRGTAVPPDLSQRFGCGWFGIGQQGPGFAVFFVAASDFTVWVRIEREAGAWGEGFDWDDVPHVEGDA
jgi:hypothetical protein